MLLKQFLAKTGFATTLILCSGVTSAEQKNTPQRLDLYFPFTSQSQPELNTKLQRQFDTIGASHIKVNTTDFWHPYQQGLKNGRKAVYFAPPHFAAWAVTRHNFKPVLKLHGQLKYVLVVRNDDANIFEASDLAGKTICRERGLNLDTVWLNQALGKHHLVAQTVEVPSTQQTMLENDEQCTAFVVSEHQLTQANSKGQQRYIRLLQSPSFQHYVFVAHSDVSTKDIERLRSILKSKDGAELLHAFFSNLSKWTSLTEVRPEDYSERYTKLLGAYWD